MLPVEMPRTYSHGKAALICEGIRGQMVFSSSGLVKISGQLAPKLVYLIERDLPKFG